MFGVGGLDVLLVGAGCVVWVVGAWFFCGCFAFWGFLVHVCDLFGWGVVVVVFWGWFCGLVVVCVACWLDAFVGFG